MADCKEGQIHVVTVPLVANDDDRVERGPRPSSIDPDRLGKTFYTGPFYEKLAVEAYMPPVDSSDGTDPVGQLVDRRVSHLEQVRRRRCCFCLILAMAMRPYCLFEGGGSFTAA